VDATFAYKQQHRLGHARSYRDMRRLACHSHDWYNASRCVVTAGEGIGWRTCVIRQPTLLSEYSVEGDA